MVKNTGFAARWLWIQSLGAPFSSCVAVDNLISLSEPHHSGAKKSTTHWAALRVTAGNAGEAPNKLYVSDDDHRLFLDGAQDPFSTMSSNLCLWTRRGEPACRTIAGSFFHFFTHQQDIGHMN